MKVISLRQVAQHLGLSEPTLRKLDLPGRVVLGKRVYYRLEAIEEFIRQGGVKSAS